MNREEAVSNQANGCLMETYISKRTGDKCRSITPCSRRWWAGKLQQPFHMPGCWEKATDSDSKWWIRQIQMPHTVNDILFSKMVLWQKEKPERYKCWHNWKGIKQITAMNMWQLCCSVQSDRINLAYIAGSVVTGLVWEKTRESVFEYEEVQIPPHI